jgi:hypothetical protein
MLDTTSIEQLVKQEVTRVVEEQVVKTLSNTDWISTVETKITKFIHDRISAKFDNISESTDLVSAVEKSIEHVIERGGLSDISGYVNPIKIQQSVDNAVQVLINQTINTLTLDTEWIAKIEKVVDQNMMTKVSKHLSHLDVNACIVKEIDNGVERWQSKLLKNFKTNGIVDAASGVKITVLDDAVVVDTGLTAASLLIENCAEISDSLTVNNLIVKGAINTDNHAWDELRNQIAQQSHALTVQSLNQEWQNSLTEQVLDRARTTGIDFATITINKQPLIKDNKLATTIVDSNLQTLGTLENLRVSGRASITGDTLTVAPKRVGINTETPEMALSIWDEEVSLISGKISKNTAFVGTARKQKLAIGINRTPYIEVDEDGLTTIKQLRLDRFRIGHAVETPGWSGTRGDVMINSDPKPGAPFAWQCLGGFKWQPIRVQN